MNIHATRLGARMTKTNDALQQLARGLEAYVMNNRDGDAFDLAMLIDNLIKERMTPSEPGDAHCEHGIDLDCAWCERCGKGERLAMKSSKQLPCTCHMREAANQCNKNCDGTGRRGV